METLNWDLHILSRALAYPNLSGAAPHVGLSQPQLSRIVHKLEADFSITILDRDAKRKSGWTREARTLVGIYAHASKVFATEVNHMLDGAMPEHVTIGTLDGLVDLGLEACDRLTRLAQVRVVELRVLDLSDLEEHFLKGSLDAIFSSRAPGAKKHRYSAQLGFQSIETLQVKNPKNKTAVAVLSPFELATMKKNKTQKQHYFVCNHLSIRQRWLAEHGGEGSAPSKVYTRKKGSTTERPVLFVAQETMNQKLWKIMTG